VNGGTFRRITLPAPYGSVYGRCFQVNCSRLGDIRRRHKMQSSGDHRSKWFDFLSEFKKSGKKLMMSPGTLSNHSFWFRQDYPVLLFVF
jgi:hypothetical protein